MARRLQKLIKVFRFEESERRNLVLDGGVRLDSQNHYLVLPDTNGAYDTSADLYAKTWVANPDCVKKWIGFESVHTNYKNSLNQQVTDVKFRLSADGVTQLYWDGADWTTAGASDWNSEAEVANNIESFPVVTGVRGMQVIMNLSTTDAAYSPRVEKVKVGYEGDRFTLEDVLFRTFKHALKENVRPIAEAAYDSEDGLATIVLETETQYQVAEIDSVYNLTTDPDMLTDLFQSYDSGTKTVTLSSAPSVGDRVLIRFTYIPDVVYAKSQDFTELSKIPAIVIERIKPVVEQMVWPTEYVINKSTHTGWRLPEGKEVDFEITLRVIASKEKDSVRMGDEIEAFVNDNTLLSLRATDDKVVLDVAERYTPQTTPSQIGMNGGRIRVRLMNAVFYLGTATTVHAAASFQVTTGQH